MASVDVSALTKTQKDELCCTYAALLLHDAELEITEEKLNKVIKASGNAVEAYWPGLFAKALKGKDIGDLMTSCGTSAAPVAAAAGAPAAGGAPAAAPKKQEKEEEVDMDMGGMFGDDE